MKYLLAALLLLAQHARNVALRDVRDLVCQYRGELRFRIGGADQPGVHADKPAGHGEGVDGRVADGEELEVLARADCHLGEPAAKRR